MSAKPRAISPEVARRAIDLPGCPPCDAVPMLVSNADGSEHYVHCPRCSAHTHRCKAVHTAKVQWRCLAAIAEVA